MYVFVYKLEHVSEKPTTKFIARFSFRNDADIHVQFRVCADEEKKEKKNQKVN